MSKKFAEYSKLDLSNVNKEVLKKWQDGDIFHKSLEIREGHPSFVFYEGPPSANGMPGIHHVIARSIKDIFCRYKTMKGYLVNRKAGWDTHGLPVELGVEKTLGITKEDIGKKISVAEYNAACRRDVMKFTKEWTDLTQKMGYWVDLENPYITYDNRYIETLWYLLKELYKKGLLYKGYTIQPYSPAAGTGLSSHELNQPGCYRDVKDTTCTAQFRILDPKPEMTAFGEPFFLAWTTTPWTLPSNTALCVGPNITYVAVQTYNPYTGMPMTAVVGKDRLDAYFNPKAAELALEDYKAGDKLVPFKVVAEWKGTELNGMKYEQLTPWVNPGEGAFRVITGDFVTTEDGTGIVHIAPTFGADDDRVAKANGVPPLMLIDKDGNKRPMVDMTGKYYLLEDLDPEYVQANMNAADYDPWQGKFVKNAYDATKGEKDETLDVEICMMLKAQNRVFRIEKHVHNYPHCWRTDKPVLYYPLDSWFIRTTACRERMIELNNTINWKPQSTGTGRFGSAKLIECGIDVIENDDSIRVCANGRPGKCTIKAMPYPGFPTDMQPQMTALLSIADGTSFVSEGVWDNRFRYVEQLTRMGASIKVEGKMAVIEGVEQLKGAPVRADDLRAGAAMIIAGLIAKGTTEIEEISHIDRGYENIVEKLTGLGADIRRVDRPEPDDISRAV